MGRNVVKTNAMPKILDEINANGGPWAKRKPFCKWLIMREIGGNTNSLYLQRKNVT